jgi:hypothetical protein
MGDIKDLGSAILVKAQDTRNHDHSPFCESFTWKFTESTSDNLDSVVVPKESRIYWCFKI